MSSPIQFSEATSIAIHSMVYIASNKEDKHGIKKIAGMIGASEAHLAKVLQRLSKMGLLKSVTGPKGGFSLAKTSEEITLLEIYEAIEGPMHLTGCPLNRQVCPFTNCIFQGLLGNVTKQIKEYFENRRLVDLIN